MAQTSYAADGARHVLPGHPMSQQLTPRRRPGAAAIGLVVALLVVAAVLAFLLLSGSGTPTSSPTPTPSSTPTAEPTLNEALLNQRLTVLVIGKDANASRTASGEPVNTDSLILASVSADQSQVTLVSLPRDTVDIPLAGGETWPQKVNALYRERGIDALVDAAAELFATEIDGYVAIDMDDLPALVDAAGGVEVAPAEPLADPGLGLELEAGRQTLDGATALAYARTRVDTDYGRAARQQEVVLELARALTAPDAEPDLAALLDGLDGLETDLPLDQLPTLAEIARRAGDAQVTRQVLQPPEFITFEGDAGDGRGYVLIPDVEAIRAFAAEHLAD